MSKVLVIMGVMGTGKSTVAKKIADQLRWDFVDGDDLHPASNVAKMASGEPLTDQERLPWLETIASWIADHRRRRLSGIVVCSALKRSYRQVLRPSMSDNDGHHHHANDEVIFVHLVGSRERIAERLSVRVGHFMPMALLDTQIATLEPIGPDEQPSLEVDTAKPADQLAAEIIDRLALNTVHLLE